MRIIYCAGDRKRNLEKLMRLLEAEDMIDPYTTVIRRLSTGAMVALYDVLTEKNKRIKKLEDDIHELRHKQNE